MAQLPVNLDARDPNFGREMRLWAFQMQCEIDELVVASKETIDASRALMAEVDRIRAWK